MRFPYAGKVFFVQIFYPALAFIFLAQQFIYALIAPRHVCTAQYGHIRFPVLFIKGAAHLLYVLRFSHARRSMYQKHPAPCKHLHRSEVFFIIIFTRAVAFLHVARNIQFIKTYRPISHCGSCQRGKHFQRVFALQARLFMYFKGAVNEQVLYLSAQILASRGKLFSA